MASLLEEEVNEAATRFIEKLGLQVETEGFSRISGRIVGFLLLQDGPYSLDALAEELQVSKASVSTNARALERVGFVERESMPGDRRDYYRIVEEPWVQILGTIREQMQNRIELLAEGQATLPAELEIGQHRLALWQEFYEFFLGRLDTHVKAWREWQASPALSGGSRGGRGISEEKQ